MVKLRLTRTGKKHEPHYRLIAISARTKRDGEAIEYLGYYNPRSNPSTVDFNIERVKYWLSVGAQPTETVKGLLVKEKVLKADKLIPRKKAEAKDTATDKEKTNAETNSKE
ncbi:MAG: 30S ribosomal protein S16 [Candidatus Dojkabacteria bacterium]